MLTLSGEGSWAPPPPLPLLLRGIEVVVAQVVRLH